MKDDNNLVVGVIIVVAVFVLLGSFGGMIGGGMMGGGMMGNWGFGGMWMFGFLFMTLILVALILFILWLVKQLQDDKR